MGPKLARFDLTKFPKIVFEIFSGTLYYTVLSLTLKYSLFEVKNWMKQQNRDFTPSMPPRWHPLAKIKTNPKNAIFNNKHKIEWARNLLNIIIFTRAAHLSHPQTLTGKKWNFSFFSEIYLFWIGLMKTAKKGPK